jgi:YD repeat-containing protein
MNNPLRDPGQNSPQFQLNDFLQSLGIDTPQTVQHSDLNLPQNHLPDYSQPPNFIHTSQPDILPDFTQAGWADHHQHHDLHQISALDLYHQQIWTVNSSYATVPGGDRTMNGPHIDIRDNGHIYLHQLNGDTHDVGDVRGHAMYNSSGWEVGYFKDNGEVYKYNYHSADNFIGKIDNGHIYNVDHKEIGRADTNLEGAAHLLFVVGGGAKT